MSLKLKFCKVLGVLPVMRIMDQPRFLKELWLTP
jgi:hypothetical protein